MKHSFTSGKIARVVNVFFVFALCAVFAVACIPATALGFQANGSQGDPETEAVSEETIEALEEGEEKGEENSWRYEDGERIEYSSTQSYDAAELLSLLEDAESQLEPYVSTISPLADTYTLVEGGLMASSGVFISSKGYVGIDVSEHNGYIDWQAVKNSGVVDFAIIRCGYGQDEAGQDDKRWVTNVEGAQAVGMKIGVYIYSYAYSAERAAGEANHVLRCLDDMGLTPSDLAFPVYYDLEESKLASTDNISLFADMAQTFCDIVEDAGYCAGIYANLNWFTNYLTDSAFEQWTKWVAQYPSTSYFSFSYTGSNATVWQCSDAGRVDGISGNVDVNFQLGLVPNFAGNNSWTNNSASGGISSDNSNNSDNNDSSGSGTDDPDDSATDGSDNSGTDGSDSSGSVDEDTNVQPSAPEDNENDENNNDWVGEDETVQSIYADVDTDEWYYNALEWATENDIIKGYDGYFYPGDQLLRQQLALILWRMAGSPDSDGEDFADTTDPVTVYAQDAIRWARSVGIVTGDLDSDGESLNTFDPDRAITREEFATMLARYASNVCGLDVSSDGSAMSAIEGAADVSPFAKEAMGWAVDQG
ncbi:MAG: S-layer homology domain-containing protein, partial [Eggerthellaceae bacterium]|nr:S-layer homology domain-containing protein [Eggerthellaceae bacterium]